MQHLLVRSARVPGVCRTLSLGALDAIKRNDIIKAASNVFGALSGNKYNNDDDDTTIDEDLLSSYYNDNAGLLDYTYGYNDYGYGYQNGGSPTYGDYSGVITKSPSSAGGVKRATERPFYADTPVEERPKKTTKAKTTSSPERKKKKNVDFYDPDSKQSQVIFLCNNEVENNGKCCTYSYS